MISPQSQNAFKDFKPDLIFNLAAQSHVRLSFDMPAFTAQVNAIGALNVFDSVKEICQMQRYIKPVHQRCLAHQLMKIISKERPPQ